MPFKESFTAFMTLVRREVTRFFRIWAQTLLPPAITMTLYFTIFGELLGSQLRDIDGYPYISYIVPGLVIMVVITNAYANVSASVFSAKFQRNLEEILISPMSNFSILTAYVAGGVVRGVVAGVIVLLISGFFTSFQIVAPLEALFIMFLTAALFSIAGFINALYAESFDDISIVPTFLLAPLTYLGGIFFSVQMLPGIWQDIAYFNPMLYVINAFRHALLGISDVNPTTSKLVVAGTTVALAILASHLLRKGTGTRQ